MSTEIQSLEAVSMYAVSMVGHSAYDFFDSQQKETTSQIRHLPQDLLEGAESLKFIEAHIHGDNPVQRQVAAIALGELQSDESVRLLLQLFGDEDRWVREIARKAATNKLSDAPQELFELLEHKDQDIREDAVRFLCELGDPKSIGYLLNHLNDKNGSISSTVRYYLKEFPQPPADIQILTTILEVWFANLYPDDLQPTALGWVSGLALDWREKLDTLMSAVKKTLFITREDLNPKIIHAITRDSSGAVHTDEAANRIIDSVVDLDYSARELGLLSLLLVELLGGSPEGIEPAVNVASAKRNILGTSASPDVLQRLNRFIRSIARGRAEDEVLGQLQQGFQANYVAVAAKLTERTMLEWQTTVGQAKSGFTARLWMNIIMFGLGVTITISGIIVVRPKSWTLGIINSRGPIKERTDEETPQIHTRVQGPGDT